MFNVQLAGSEKQAMAWSSGARGCQLCALEASDMRQGERGRRPARVAPGDASAPSYPVVSPQSVLACALLPGAVSRDLLSLLDVGSEPPLPQPSSSLRV